MFKIFSLIDENNKFLNTYSAQESPRELGVFIAPENSVEGEPTIPAVEGKDRYFIEGEWIYVDIEEDKEEQPATPIIKTQFSSLEFLDRFTEEEQLAVVSATLNNPVIKLWYDRLLAASFIDLSDPRTEAGIDALIGAELIAHERKEALMQPE